MFSLLFLQNITNTFDAYTKNVTKEELLKLRKKRKRLKHNQNPHDSENLPKQKSHLKRNLICSAINHTY